MTNYISTITKVQDFQITGVYKNTVIDDKKKSVDFLLIGTSPFQVRMKNGDVLTVTKKELAKMQLHQIWSTDF